MDVFECGHHKYDVKTQKGKKTEALKIERHPRETKYVPKKFNDKKTYSKYFLQN